MDLERSRIKADLDGLLEGEVFCDDVRLQLYASDGSIHQIRPLAVVRPTGTDDVVACVRYAAENQLPVHARGAGTSVTGGPLGRGIVVDFSAAMRRVLSIGDDRVRLQPGVVLASLNRQLQEHQRLFGPDPALRSVTTLGGLLSTNASGSHWLRYGSPRDKVQRLQLVLADASVIELNGRDAEPGDADPRVARLASEVSGLLRRRWTSLQEAAPATRVNHAGYSLTDLGGPDAVDLRRLIVGSEGTLGLITQAEVALDPIPAQRGVTLLFFDRLEAAARAGIDTLGLDVVACDLMDRRLLTIAREDDPRFARLIPAEAEAMLLVEQEGNTIDELQAKIQQLIQRLQRRRRLAFGSRFAIEVHERNLYWRLARRVTPSLYRLRGSQQAIPFVEEMAVAPDRLPAFLAEAHGVLNSLEVTASIFAHVGQGLVHLRPFLDLANAADRDKLLPLAERLYEKVLEFRGTVSGQYGDGLSRSWFLPRQYGRVYEAMREVKQLFDPANLLNPGKIVGDPPVGLTQQLRPVGVAAHWTAPAEAPPAGAESGRRRRRTGLPVLRPLLAWDPEAIAAAARACNGCGRCRTTSPDQRMCPIFRLAPQEEASPRAKANLLRGLMSGELPPESIGGDTLKEIADLCVHCHQCRLECPATVDIPKLMVEAKAQHVAASGLPISGWLLTRLDLLYWVGSRFPWVTNRILHSRSARWLLDRLFGLAQGRKLPRFARRSLTRWARGQGLHRPSRSARHKVLYFVDAVANWNDVELGRALVHVLRHNGITVFVPPAPSLSGMSLISEGLVDRARRLAQRNVELLAEHVRQGHHVVTTEPSAALALKHEYLHLLDDPDAALVAANTSDACTYLWNLHKVGQLELNFRPVNARVGYHLPCHQRALGGEVPGLELLDLVPGLVVELLDRGCSGMAGVYGLKRRNYRRSLRAGIGLRAALRRPELDLGATECSTCRIQMEHGTTKSTVHPIKVLALAYGLMPELNDLLNRRSPWLTLS